MKKICECEKGAMYKQFVGLVKEMRQEQKNNKVYASIEKARQLEKEVDAMVKELLEDSDDYQDELL